MRVDDVEAREDEILRSIFAREARFVPVRCDAPAALHALHPAIRRAAQRRAALIAAAVVLTAGGAAAFARSTLAPDGGAIGISSRPTPTESVPPIIEVPAARPDASPLTVPEMTISDLADGGEASGRSPSPVVTDDVDTGQRADTTVPAASDPAPTPAPTVAAAPVAPPPPVVTTTVVTTTTAAPVPSTVIDHVTPCGTITADLATTPPTILSITPAAGFTSQVEDADHGVVTVHLVGQRRTCEVHVGAATDEEHHDDESQASPGDDDD